MSFINKFAWSGVAVVLAAVLMLGILVPSVSAVGSVVASSTSTISVAPIAPLTTVGPGTPVAYPASTITISVGATSDFSYNTGSTGTIVVALPSGWSWVTAPTVTLVGLTGVSQTPAAAISGVNLTISLSGSPSADGSITIASGTIRANANTSASGDVSVSSASTVQIRNVPVGTVLGRIAATAFTATAPAHVYLARLANATACGTTNPITTLDNSTNTLPADGSTGGQLCATVSDVLGLPVGGVPVTFTASVGYVSTGTGKTVLAFTNSAGNATTNYRGAGSVASTDTVVASIPSLSLVADPLTVTLTAPTGGTAVKVAILTPTIQGLAASITTTVPGYSSPTSATNVALQVTDVSGIGVGSQSVQITVDRGTLVANVGFAAEVESAKVALCSTATAKSIIVATTLASNRLAPGSAVAITPGTANFTVCTSQLDAVGKITLTASNITTSMPNATLTLVQAGLPAKINVKVDGSTITATVVDSAGNVVADGTPINFTISSTVGAVSTLCALSTNGAATSVVALTGAIGNVLVSTSWNDTSSAPTCSGTGTRSLASNVALPSGTAVGTGTGTPAAAAPAVAGSGLLVGSGTVPKAGSGLIVFGGGTTDQLVTASGCAKATSSFYATNADGQFVTFVPGTTIAAVNAGFTTLYAAGIPANTALIGKCA